MNALEIKPYMSASDFVNDIKEDLGFNMDKIMADDDSFIIRHIFYANHELGVPLQLEIKRTSLQVVECQVKKPCDYVKLIGLTVGPCCIVPTYTKPTQKSNRRGVYQYGDYDVQEMPYFFTLSSNADGCDLNIEYNSYNFDENGYPFVDLTYREAITMYIRWKYIIRMRTIGMGARAGLSSGDETNARLDYARFAGINKARKRMDALTLDAVNQITAKWCDPLYVPTNPFLRKIQQHNTVHIHGQRYGFPESNTD